MSNSMSVSGLPLEGGISKGLNVGKEALVTIGTGVSSAFHQGDNLPTQEAGVQVLKTAFKYALLTAITYYGTKWLIAQLDPTLKQKRVAKERARRTLDSIVKNSSKKSLVEDLSEYELMIAGQLVNPKDMTVSWNDIAGLGEVIQELHETVILPIQRAELFRQSRLVQAPKGVLLYGPPGCGKTLIAKATAKESGANFIHLDVSVLTDKWYGESQKLAAAIFSLAAKIQPCIVFVDEIDSLLRSRGSHDHEATAMMKAQFMSLWDGLGTDPDCIVIIMGATNRPGDIDPAILRRMPAAFHIKLPNVTQREQIVRLILSKDDFDSDVDVKTLAHGTEGFSGSDLHELCRTAALIRIQSFLKSENASRNRSGRSTVDDNCPAVLISPYRSTIDNCQAVLKPIKMVHLEAALKKVRESKHHYTLE